MVKYSERAMLTAQLELSRWRSKKLCDDNDEHDKAVCRYILHPPHTVKWSVSHPEMFLEIINKLANLGNKDLRCEIKISNQSRSRIVGFVIREIQSKIFIDKYGFSVSQPSPSIRRHSKQECFCLCFYPEIS